MSYIFYDSSIIKEKAASAYNPQKTEEEQKPAAKSSIQVFNATLPESCDTDKVQNAEAQTGGNSDSTEQKAAQNRDIDVKDLTKKYKKNPEEVLKELGIDFTDEQKEALKGMLTDKKSLKSFLEIVKEGSLNSQDIVEGMKKVHDFKPSGFFKRIGNTIKTLFKEGISEAVDLAKSETVHYSAKLSENMGDIREERQDFSSKGVANVAQAMTNEPEIKESTMHFVRKEQISGKKLYNENDVTQAADIMSENVKDAKTFKDNAVELESIKDENGVIKYTGETIINVDKKMIENKDLKLVMLKTAQKSDMTNNYLVEITDNVIENPEMKIALEKFLDTKDKNGKDRFSANNILSQSEYMVDKDSKKITSYANNTIQAAKDSSKNSNNIVASEARNAANSPANLGTKDKTITTHAANDNRTTSLPISPNTRKNYEQNDVTKLFKKQSDLNNILSQNHTYTKQEVIELLQRKFDPSSADEIYRQLSNPEFLPLLKKYGNNKDIIKALLKDKKIVDKFNSVSSSITSEQLGKLLKLATSPEKVEIMLALVSRFGPAKAIAMGPQALESNNTNKVIEVLKGDGDTTAQKEKLENELYGVGANRTFMC